MFTPFKSPFEDIETCQYPKNVRLQKHDKYTKKYICEKTVEAVQTIISSIKKIKSILPSLNTNKVIFKLWNMWLGNK